MNAKEAIQLVVEAKTPEGWTTTRGVYGNFSNWPREVEYYVKCPKCGLVHGNFKTLRDAELKKLCDTCNIDAINAIKDQVQDVIHDPEHKPKSMAKIVHEDENAPFDPFDEPPELEGVPIPPEDEPDLGTDATKGEITRLLLNNWLDVAFRDLSEKEGIGLTDIEISRHQHHRGLDYDPDAPGDSTGVMIEFNGNEYLLFKDHDAAETFAINRVKSDLENEPEIFTQDWLKDFVNEERLKQAIGDPNEDWDEEVRNMDYEELLDKMVDEGFVDYDDTVFFKKNGDKRVETKLRVKLLNDYMEQYIEKNKPEPPDPWDWLQDVYGKDEATKQAIQMAGIDVDAAAKSAVSTDGVAHFIATYDGHENDLENGAVYYRTN